MCIRDRVTAFMAKTLQTKIIGAAALAERFKPIGDGLGVTDQITQPYFETVGLVFPGSKFAAPTDNGQYTPLILHLLNVPQEGGIVGLQPWTLDAEPLPGNRMAILEATVADSAITTPRKLA